MSKIPNIKQTIIQNGIRMQISITKNEIQKHLTQLRQKNKKKVTGTKIEIKIKFRFKTKNDDFIWPLGSL